MSAELGDILSRLPADKRFGVETCEYFDKEIRRGADLNALQRDGVLSLIQLCLDQNLDLPSPYESFWAYVYQEWSEEAKNSEDVKKKAIKLVQRIKANAALASKVSQTVQQILKERGKRREEMAKLAAALAASAAAPTRLDKRAGTARETPNQYVNLMQAARLGRGTNPTPNLELAAQIAEEAVDAFPGSPKVLFEAAGCHQLLAEKGTLHSAMVRYVHMKEAYSLYQQCLTILAGPPYVTLKDEYDQWRKGLAELILKAQKELAHLQEQQERLG